MKEFTLYDLRYAVVVQDRVDEMSSETLLAVSLQLVDSDNLVHIVT